jgi:hypothetical protein
MTIKKNRSKLVKKTGNKKSSAKNSKTKKEIPDDIVSFTEEFSVDSNGNLQDDDDNVAISEENYTLVNDYQCSMSSYQDPEEGNWRFALEILTDNGKLIDIHSQQTYETFQDSIFDCYGIIEYLGFGILDPKNCAHIVVNYWDEEKKEFREELVYFDGCDFFKNQKVSTASGV